MYRGHDLGLRDLGVRIRPDKGLVFKGSCVVERFKGSSSVLAKLLLLLLLYTLRLLVTNLCFPLSISQ